MSDARWIEVEDDIVIAADHFAKATELFRLGGFDSPGIHGYGARMAFLHSMHAAHTSLENGLKRTLSILGEECPAGDSWHEDLIRRISREIAGKRPAIFDREIANFADESRRFRHVADRSYNNFRPQEATKAVAAANALAVGIVPAFNRFRELIDPPENNGGGDGSGGGMAKGPR